MLKIVTLPGCEPCEDVLAAAKPLIDAGEMQVIDGMSDEGQAFLQAHPEVNHVPFLFVEEVGGLRSCALKRGSDGGVVVDCDGSVNVDKVLAE